MIFWKKKNIKKIFSKKNHCGVQLWIPISKWLPRVKKSVKIKSHMTKPPCISSIPLFVSSVSFSLPTTLILINVAAATLLGKWHVLSNACNDCLRQEKGYSSPVLEKYLILQDFFPSQSQMTKVFTDTLWNLYVILIQNYCICKDLI